MRVFSFIRLVSAAFAAGLALAAPASAFEQKAYDKATFDAAEAAGTPVLVHVTAPWCPTCKAQHQVLDGLAKKPEYSSVTIYQVDFDSQKDVLKAFKANSQSTLIAFKGGKEVGRLVGETKPKAIETLIASTTAK